MPLLIVLFAAFLTLGRPVHADVLKAMRAGNLALSQGQAQLCYERYEQVLQEDPLQAQAWYGASLCAWMQGQTETALTKVEESLRLDPSFGAAQTLRSDLELALAQGTLQRLTRGQELRQQAGLEKAASSLRLAEDLRSRVLTDPGMMPSIEAAAPRPAGPLGDVHALLRASAQSVQRLAPSNNWENRLESIFFARLSYEPAFTWGHAGLSYGRLLSSTRQGNGKALVDLDDLNGSILGTIASAWSGGLWADLSHAWDESGQVYAREQVMLRAESPTMGLSLLWFELGPSAEQYPKSLQLENHGWNASLGALQWLKEKAWIFAVTQGHWVKAQDSGYDANSYSFQTAARLRQGQAWSPQLDLLAQWNSYPHWRWDAGTRQDLLLLGRFEMVCFQWEWTTISVGDEIRWTGSNAAAYREQTNTLFSALEWSW